VPASVQIRRATPADAAAIAAVLYESFREFRPLYTDGGFAATTPDSGGILARMKEGPVWVALGEKVTLGTVAAVLQSESLYIRGMAVLPAARGAGVGQRLMSEIELYAASAGCQRLFLSTTPFLNSAIRLYEKLGFRRCATEAQALFGTPLFTMEKILFPHG
jgi:ribosomal protein S18 acetylase RimI-like enzyme